MASQVGTDPALLPGVNDQPLPVHPRADAEPLEAEQGAAQIIGPDAFDSDAPSVIMASPMKLAISMIGADGEPCSSQEGDRPRWCRRWCRFLRSTRPSRSAERYILHVRLGGGKRRTVRPCAMTAAGSAFSVPVTLGSSRKISAPVSLLPSIL
jgi:hypothetical protein